MGDAITKHDIEILKKYVTHHDCNEEDIVKLCKKQQPITLTVYRGQRRNKTLHASDTYSSSLVEEAANKFAGEHGEPGYLFTIHLVNVPCIQVNKLIGTEISSDRRKEDEIIFLGGGNFYTDKNCNEEGFTQIASKFKNKKNFECWYTLKKKHASTGSAAEKKKTGSTSSTGSTGSVDSSKIERALDIINEDEYDFIDTVDDIDLPSLHLTDEEKIEILKIILEKKGKKEKKGKDGGAKKNNKMRKQLKKKISKKKSIKKKYSKRRTLKNKK